MHIVNARHASDVMPVVCSIVGVEMCGEKEASEFLAKYKNHVLRDHKLKLSLYSERLAQFKTQQPKQTKTDREGAIVITLISHK